jgi:ankyrin repeat protein
MGNQVATRRPVDSQALQRLHTAAFDGNLPAVKQLVEGGVDVNGILVHDEVRQFGTPLAQAVRGRHIDIVAYLMANGASLSVKNGIDSHMLHYAAKCGFVEAMEYFIRWRDVSPSLVCTLNQSALHLACRSGHLNVVEYLVTNHGGLNARAKTRYQTPLHVAAHVGPAVVLKFLVDSGADVGATRQRTIEFPH